MIETAKKYHSYGLSVLPVNEKKLPLVAWDAYKNKLIEPIPQFANAWGVAIVCGVVSGNIECLDIDCKYDLTGNMFNEFKTLIREAAPGLDKKMVVERSIKGGYHLIYRCKKIEGNLKLASRYTTEEEKKINAKEKRKVLFETRGEGGYFVAYPTVGYDLKYGSFDKIQEITPQERDVLFTCAKSFNQVFEEYKPIKHKELNRGFSDEENPFNSFNDRGDITSVLLSAGWTISKDNGKKTLWLRPGGTGMWSADYDSERRLLYVFTTSSEFDSEKAYNHSAVLAKVKFNNDWSATARYLLDIGFGKKRNEVKIQSTPKADPLRKDFLASHGDMDQYISSVRDGSFKMGLETRIPELDKHFRLKDKSLIVCNGHDNVGKSVIIWYTTALSSLFYEWKHGILAAENKVGGVKRKMMEFYLCKNVKEMTVDEVSRSAEWVKKHFFIIKNDSLYSYKDFLNMGKVLCDEYGINSLLGDPYNSFTRSTNNHHEYDYEATNDMKLFISKNNCNIILNCHAVTDSLRRVYPKGHKYYDFPMPPGKADTEGGGKFSNRADDFITIHRLTQHPHEWMYTDIHVRKVREMETGGKPTPKDEPVRLEMVKGGCGFKALKSGVNPVENFWNEIKYDANDYEEKNVPVPLIDYTESKKDDEIPF